LEIELSMSQIVVKKLCDLIQSLKCSDQVLALGCGRGLGAALILFQYSVSEVIACKVSGTFATLQTH